MALKFDIKKKTSELLSKIGSPGGLFENAAFNLRENGSCAGRQSTKNISIESHPDGDGLLIKIAPGTKGEKVYIPACVTESGVVDTVLNEIIVGEGADVEVVAGCGVHSDGGEAAHSGLHRFVIEKNAKMEYIEKHIGSGSSSDKAINTKSEFIIREGAAVRVVSEQIGGVDNAHRDTVATLEADAVFIVNERLMTDGDDKVSTEFTVTMNGDGSKADVSSRSVARGRSRQSYVSRIEGNAVCTGHTECDAILTEKGAVDAAPCLAANCTEASLIHEAAIGKIAGEQITKLCSLGLTQAEAEQKIIEGFLR